MRCFHTLVSRWSVLLVLAVLLAAQARSVRATTVSLPSVRDNTLFQYDPDDPNSLFNSNGSGDFFAAGRTYKKSQLRRGLVQFDVSSIPAGVTVVEGSARLDLHVVDAPRNDKADRPFWLVPLAGLGHMWDEGASVANAGGGAGSGAAAAMDDATWLHTNYDPNTHNQTTFIPDGDGFWPQRGALGNGPLNPFVYGAPVAIVPSAIGPVSFAGPSMEADINDWLQDPASNLGWIVLGDEMIVGNNVSSNRGFATREADNATFHPRLTFAYVPEPGTTVLLVPGVLLVLLPWRRRRGRHGRYSIRYHLGDRRGLTVAGPSAGRSVFRPNRLFSPSA